MSAFACPVCHRVFEASPDARGLVRCPVHHQFQIPAQSRIHFNPGDSRPAIRRTAPKGDKS
jgi:hypothetical protein